MAQKVADPCRNCGAELAPGASFCTLCGTAMSNRAAAPVQTTVPVGTPSGDSAAAVPGIIAVGAAPLAPVVPPRQLGSDPRLAAATALVPGGAGRRLSAWLLDAVVPGILMGVGAGVGVALIKVTRVGNQDVVDLSWLGILVGIASVLSLGWVIFQWLWEARTGKTLGNLLLGLRTTNMDGHPAGVLAIFLRLLIVSVSSIVPTIGPLLVVLSNAWDGNGKRQGWHDKVAHTLVFNVRAGRNPLETGGLAERANFTPPGVQTISPVAPPMVHAGQGAGQLAPSATAPADTVGRGNRGRTKGPAAAAPYGGTFAPPSPVAAQEPVAAEHTGPITSVPGFTAPPDVAAAAQADDDAGETRVRPLAGTATAFRLVFDDGRHEEVSALALIGRNPAGYDGEMISRLISVLDTSRSVSKTHLHVRVSSEGLWVTDRNSTNGSAISTAAGTRTRLTGGTPALADIGARVHFGDRSFVVTQA